MSPMLMPSMHPMSISDDEDDDSDDSCAETGIEDDPAPKHLANFECDVCHVMLLQQCKCTGVCDCKPDVRVPDTIYYKRDPKYEAKTIPGSVSMFAYRFLPRRPYIVQIRQYACETCPSCRMGNTDRYNNCTKVGDPMFQDFKVSFKIYLHIKILKKWVYDLHLMYFSVFLLN